MVEVFKTNVKDTDQANLLLSLIHRNFQGYQANFDLDDCDRILRVKGVGLTVQAHFLIDLLQDLGVKAEVLSDDQPIVHKPTLRYMCGMFRSHSQE